MIETLQVGTVAINYVLTPKSPERPGLKTLCKHFNVDIDVAQLKFPNKMFSLSHSNHVSVTAGSPCASIAGLGVDFEAPRKVNSDMGRFFLTPRERTTSEQELLRLWTVKEALFKACPDNEGRLLSDFETAMPTASAGKATLRDNPSFRFYYHCRKIAAGFLSFAVCFEDNK